MDPTAAKQFLVSKVLDEAELEHVTLSEIEKKMLLFTEVQPSLPDIYEVNAEFERDYDSDEYERKVTGFLRRARERDQEESAVLGRRWTDAVDALKTEDHYILVMVYRAFPEYRKILLPTHRVHDYLIYIGIGVGLVALAIGIAVLKK